jgi:Ni/Co efflux regulator RcnB
MSPKWSYLLIAALLLSLTPKIALADHDHDDHGRGHAWGHERHDRDDDDDRDRRYYRDHDRELHEWYETHREHLPPGLAKRDQLPPGLERQLMVRGTLPPGLRGRMHHCPEEVERYLPPPPAGYVHTVIGGHIVLMNPRTYFVLDVFHFEM